MEFETDTKQADDKANIEAKRFKTFADKANLYIFSDDFMISTLNINGKQIGDLQDDTFFKLTLRPGTYTLKMTGTRFKSKKSIHELKIKLLKNTNHFVELNTHAGVPPYGTIAEVSDLDGKKGVNECRLLIHNNISL